MALPLDDLATWLDAEGFAGALVNWMPDSPDAVLVLSGAGGEPPNTDGAFEVSHVHIRCRATTDAEAEAAAIAVHRLITGVTNSFTAGSTYVKSVQSIAGPPQYGGRDVDKRTTYMAIYAFDCPTA